MMHFRANNQFERRLETVRITKKHLIKSSDETYGTIVVTNKLPGVRNNASGNIDFLKELVLCRPNIFPRALFG